ncbi:ribonucleases P/MRP protein subunit POP1 isoform X1 [Henckelia pumila]|uniref:ribonucleases P/MRP protein subunit POP1 isoform X1 n=1 Tax=Henckelia pumila TaxID=405737 RepID=UPI003C6DFD32
MVVNASKPRVSKLPPHELNVRKFAESRASELEGLHSVVANRLDNDFRSLRNKRKRTTGHDNRVARKKYRKKKRVESGNSCNNDRLEKHEKKVSRRTRRSIELKKNPQIGFCTSGDGTKRLRTHVWHAKRFSMTKLWGFHIPLGLHGRGRGSRALLKKLRSGVLIHDASYYGTVQLEGPQDKLLSVLSSVLVPPPSKHDGENFDDILSGDIFGRAVLHHTGKPSFPSIAPVTFMWRPLQHITIHKEGDNVNMLDELQSNDDGATFRRLWVCIHAAALKEASEALAHACMDMTGGSARCVSLEGHLATLELIGSKASELVEKMLPPACYIPEKSWYLKQCNAAENSYPGKLEKTPVSKINNQISSSLVIPLTVKDPRALTMKQQSIFTLGNSCNLLRYEEVETEHESESVVDYGDLWDASEGICPPMEESVACMEKYYQRNEYIGLGITNFGNQNALVKGKYSRYCPVLLLKNENHEDSVKRCSIVLPLSWVKVFWNAFVLNGAHAIGLREKHWIACEIGLPYFPWDYPDCSAYSYIMEMDATAMNQRATLCPPSQRPLEIPIPPPWDCVKLIVKPSSEVGNSLNQDEGHGSADVLGDNLVRNSVCGLSDTTTIPFEGFVARTSCSLNDFLNNISASHLLLFPRMKDQKTCMPKFMNDEEHLEQIANVSGMQCGNTRCFLRVHIHAHKEGVFEQGAVICAPDAADIMSWTRSDCDNHQLQIPQSSLRSHFVRLPSGKWALQIPEDPAVRESYRRPIGFITTGFVRGSKKPTAGALCEAILLARLRLEQWKALPARRRRKEIFVLVRNMRSTAYRLGLATIVLEQQEEDVKFM